MMKVYICPKCGWLRAVSRRKNVECFKCGNEQMALVKISYEKFAEMDEKQREDYRESWLYIHRNDVRKEQEDD